MVLMSFLISHHSRLLHALIVPCCLLAAHAVRPSARDTAVNKSGEEAAVNKSGEEARATQAFQRISSGTCRAVGMTNVTSSESCAAAAKALGLAYISQTFKRSDTRPTGCICDDNALVYQTGTSDVPCGLFDGQSTYDCICQQAANESSNVDDVGCMFEARDCPKESEFPCAIIDNSQIDALVAQETFLSDSPSCDSRSTGLKPVKMPATANDRRGAAKDRFFISKIAKFAPKKDQGDAASFDSGNESSMIRINPITIETYPLNGSDPLGQYTTLVKVNNPKVFGRTLYLCHPRAFEHKCLAKLALRANQWQPHHYFRQSKPYKWAELSVKMLENEKRVPYQVVRSVEFIVIAAFAFTAVVWVWGILYSVYHLLQDPPWRPSSDGVDEHGVQKQKHDWKAGSQMSLGVGSFVWRTVFHSMGRHVAMIAAIVKGICAEVHINDVFFLTITATLNSFLILANHYKQYSNGVEYADVLKKRKEILRFHDTPPYRTFSGIAYFVMTLCAAIKLLLILKATRGKGVLGGVATYVICYIANGVSLTKAIKSASKWKEPVCKVTGDGGEQAEPTTTDTYSVSLSLQNMAKQCFARSFVAALVFLVVLCSITSAIDPYLRDALLHDVVANRGKMTSHCHSHNQFMTLIVDEDVDKLTLQCLPDISTKDVLIRMDHPTTASWEIDMTLTEVNGEEAKWFVVDLPIPSGILPSTITLFSRGYRNLTYTINVIRAGMAVQVGFSGEFNASVHPDMAGVKFFEPRRLRYMLLNSSKWYAPDIGDKVNISVYMAPVIYAPLVYDSIHQDAPLHLPRWGPNCSCGESVAGFGDDCAKTRYTLLKNLSGQPCVFVKNTLSQIRAGSHDFEDVHSPLIEWLQLKNREKPFLYVCMGAGDDTCTMMPNQASSMCSEDGNYHCQGKLSSTFEAPNVPIADIKASSAAIRFSRTFDDMATEQFVVPMSFDRHTPPPLVDDSKWIDQFGEALGFIDPPFTEGTTDYRVCVAYPYRMASLDIFKNSVSDSRFTLETQFSPKLTQGCSTIRETVNTYMVTIDRKQCNGVPWCEVYKKRRADQSDYIFEEMGTSPFCATEATIRDSAIMARSYRRCKHDVISGMTPLMTAARRGLYGRAIQWIEEFGANINFEVDNSTALVQAVEDFDVKMVYLLASRGADMDQAVSVNARVVRGSAVGRLITQQFLARTDLRGARTPTERMLEALLAAGSNLSDAIGLFSGSSLTVGVNPCAWMIETDSAALLEIIMANYKGAEECLPQIKENKYFRRNSAGTNALMHAAMSGQLKRVMFFVFFGADLTHRNSDHYTALLLARSTEFKFATNTLQKKRIQNVIRFLELAESWSKDEYETAREEWRKEYEVRLAEYRDSYKIAVAVLAKHNRLTEVSVRLSKLVGEVFELMTAIMYEMQYIENHKDLMEYNRSTERQTAWFREKGAIRAKREELLIPAAFAHKKWIRRLEAVQSEIMVEFHSAETSDLATFNASMERINASVVFEETNCKLWDEWEDVSALIDADQGVLDDLDEVAQEHQTGGHNVNRGRWEMVSKRQKKKIRRRTKIEEELAKLWAVPWSELEKRSIKKSLLEHGHRAFAHR